MEDPDRVPGFEYPLVVRGEEDLDSFTECSRLQGCESLLYEIAFLLSCEGVFSAVLRSILGIPKVKNLSYSRVGLFLARSLKVFKKTED